MSMHKVHRLSGRRCVSVCTRVSFSFALFSWWCVRLYKCVFCSPMLRYFLYWDCCSSMRSVKYTNKPPLTVLVDCSLTVEPTCMYTYIFGLVFHFFFLHLFLCTCVYTENHKQRFIVHVEFTFYLIRVSDCHWHRYKSNYFTSKRLNSNEMLIEP